MDNGPLEVMARVSAQGDGYAAQEERRRADVLDAYLNTKSAFDTGHSFEQTIARSAIADRVNDARAVRARLERGGALEEFGLAVAGPVPEPTVQERSADQGNWIVERARRKLAARGVSPRIRPRWIGEQIENDLRERHVGR